LLESELFGHEKGAFTGAVARRIGKFEEANGGTLLLDEISEMHPRLQAKLLRAVQEREIDRVGGLQPIKVDIRLIATSNRDLEAEVRAGNFREDLFFRLNVVHLEVPPLRERPKDIALLAEFFSKKYAEANAVPERPLTPEAVQMLTRHAWRGNVRELENTVHRAVLLATGPEIDVDAIELAPIGGGTPKPPQRSDDGASGDVSGLVGRRMDEVERDLILSTLAHTLGNRTHAATILGISIRALRNKLRDYAAQGAAVPPPMLGVVA
jgi:two-component system, response regulator FlrC